MDRRGPEPPTQVASENGRPGGSPTLHVATSPTAREDLRVGDQIGRFTVLGRLGGGSMGVVYSAYDDVLDRKVAVKLVRRRGGQNAEQSRVRLVREAQAMARLSHPNVVAVYEAGTAGDEVFVAMEFVHGETLFAWTATPRTWQEVLAVYVQAARGLAAAHAAGLVHRDFKPGNVMLGSDGRVRVLDFGLVQPLSASQAPEESGEAAATTSVNTTIRTFLGQRMTHEGQVMGTPAYMSPEQLAGAAIDPKSDQFSFCAALYESLYGELPFRGATLPELIAVIRAGKLREPPRTVRVPNWLRRAVVRGLSGDPDQRYPSMEALLAELDRRPVRWRRTLAASLAVAAATSGFLVARASGPAPALCSGAEDALGDAWDTSRRAALLDAMNITDFSRAVWPQVFQALDAYAADWMSAHRDACLASQRGEQSGAMLDRRMACLSQSRTSLGEATRLLATGDRRLAVHALELVNALPPVSLCSDVQALAAAVAPPPPAAAEAVSALRDRLTRAKTLATAGQLHSAQEEIDRVIAEARQTDYPPVLAEALLLRGRLSLNTAGASAENVMLTEAVLAAVAAGDDESAAEALALRIYVRGHTPGMTAFVKEDIALAEAFMDRLPRPERLRPLLLNNIGTVYLAEGNTVRARSYFSRALDAGLQTRLPGDLQHAYTLVNLAFVGETHAERERLMLEALAIFERTLGSVHPQTIDALISASMYILDPRSAAALLRPRCDDLDAKWKDNQLLRARCRLYLGLHLAEAGEPELAARQLRRADSLLALASPETLAELGFGQRARITGYAALYSDPPDHGAVVDRLEAFLADLAQVEPDEWVRRERAEVELVLGLNYLRAARQHPDPNTERAIAALMKAVEGLDAARAKALDVAAEQHLALAHFKLAEALLSRRQAGEAASHIYKAETWYRGAGDGYRWRLPALERLAAQLAP